MASLKVWIIRDCLPMSGVRVRAGTQTVITDESGCAFFRSLAPGEYDISTELGENEIKRIALYDKTIVFIKMIYS